MVTRSIGGVVGFLLAAVIGVIPAARAAPDPFHTAEQVAPSPAASVAAAGLVRACGAVAMPVGPLTLDQVVDRALCNNPQTREAWANARAQAAALGVSRSALLPSLDAAASYSHNNASGRGAQTGLTPSYDQEAVGLSLNYLLYDFGGRRATIANAQAVLAAANASQDAAIQTVFLEAVQAYYQRLAAQAAVDAAVEAEKSAAEGLKAAVVRYQVGAGTLADKLQAQTAYSQAVLNRIQAEGNLRIAEGTLANAMGLDANVAVAVAPAPAQTPDQQFERDVSRLIEEARRDRPDLAAAEAQIRAAQASIKSERAAGLPTLSLAAGVNYNDTSVSEAFHSSAVTLNLSVPLFTGYGTTYRIRAAEAQEAAVTAQRDQLNQQIALDVWTAYQTLITDTHSVKSSADLVASASESARVALGRYKAGAGNILDVVTAQSALAAARQQQVQALYGWYMAKASLARAMGQLNGGSFGADAVSSGQPPITSPEHQQ